ncbi:MAG: toll/interleukin-1 receptor domain-containing protein [Proteobacteria bacterium]|nr:toll/interleukin-1 receptor domain-containing protein [Pseudomonadota bacterium]MBU4294607.1 toll/interleukin-1 receptor domain-containing protein [Pseudomonadota bacterium]MCG2747142.1 toll/interleukin-1 receptor domain-containing protein [Desulfobulbaceae bacterium]
MEREGYSDRIVFVSYAVLDQVDHEWLERLRRHVKPLEKRYHFEFWDDSKIQPGNEWQHEIEKALDCAEAAVLLVGPAFLASDFIGQIELPRLLRRAKEMGLPILILITQHCNFEESDLVEFQAFKLPNQLLRPLEALPVPDQNEYLKKFSLAIKRAVEYRTLPGYPPNNLGKVRHNLLIKPINVIGRDQEIEFLLSSFEAHDKPVILASGFGGVGKSTVALVAAWKCVERHQPFKFIVWLDLRQYGPEGKAKPITLGFVLDSIAKVANPTSEIVSIGDPEVKTARVRELLAATRSLLIFDNYEGLLENPDEEEKVARFIESLPICPSSDENCPCIRVLITTRVVSPTLARLPIYNKRLRKLPFQKSLKMMKSQPGARNLTKQQWKRVWEILQGLPKYMQIAVGQLKEMTFSDWEEEVTKIQWQPDRPDDFFSDLFDSSWNNQMIISEDLRQILLAMTYFIGRAKPNELHGTSGLSKERFRDALASRFNASYLEVVRDESGQEYYTMHPLMYTYCAAALNSEEFREFRKLSSARFVDCFLRFAEGARENNDLNLLDGESQNILAAVRVGGRLKSWENLIGFRRYIADFLRLRGAWGDYCEIVELAVNASRALGKEVLLAECLVYDLAWYYLRLEDVQTAQEFINEGLILFEKHQHRPGMAQAKRHLGKAAVLDGLNEIYEPNQLAGEYFDRAEQYYRESLDLREQLQEEGYDQCMAIADMKLDFGRLYWLQGMKLEQDGRLQQDDNLLGQALEKYKKADSVSEEARQEFKLMPLSEEVSKGRIAKAWGNRGNAAKEIACYMGWNHKWAYVYVKNYVETAKSYYGKNLSLGKEIKKEDEIAHALAGLAEVGVIESRCVDPSMDTKKKRSFLEKAKENAHIAHSSYEELAGPRGQMGNPLGTPAKKTRDEIRTEQLTEKIGYLLASLPE